MRVAMVDVREVRVFVRNRGVPMPVSMRFVTFPSEVVRVLVVLVMDMAMTMLDWLVPVFMLVVLGQVQVDPPAHQAGR